MTALTLRVTPEATDLLNASREKFKAKAKLSLLFPIFWKLLLRMLPWIIEMLIPLILAQHQANEDIIFPVSEPYLVGD